MSGICQFLRCLVCSALLASIPAHGALTQLSANIGEVPDLLAVSNQVVFAATAGGGLYKSANQGDSWVRQSGLSAQYVHKLAGRDGQSADSEIVYACTSVGVYRTLNGGTSWTQIYPNEAHAISVDPTNSNNVVLGVRGLGILRTTTGTTTATWAYATGLDSTDITALVHDSTGANVYAALNSNKVAFWGGVFKSVNGGATWSAANAGFPDGFRKFVRHLAVDDTNNVYAALDYAIGSGGVWRLDAGAAAWAQVPTTAPFPGGAVANASWVIKAVHHDRGTPGRMWAGTGPYAAGYWRADNAKSGGAGFYYAVQTDKTQTTIANAFATFSGSPDVLLVALNGLGIYKSSSSGVGLSGGLPNVPLAASNTGLAADRIAAFAPAPSAPGTIYMGALGGGVFKSTNSGASWSMVNSGFDTPLGAGAQNDQIFSATHMAVSQSDPNEVFAGILGRGLYRSANGGTDWAAVNEAGLSNSPVTPISRNLRPRSIVTAAGGVTYYSVFDMPDGDSDLSNDQAGVYRRAGTTWTRVVKPFFPGNSGAGKVVVGSKFVALLNDTLPFVSADGINFTQLTGAQTPVAGNAVPDAGFARLYFYDLAFKPAATSTVVAATNKGLYRSTDSAATFTAVAVGGALTSTTFTAVGYSAGGLLFVGTPDGNLFCSSNDGGSFLQKAVPGGWAGSQVKSIVLAPGGTTLYFVTDGNGVWQETAPACP